MTDRTAQVHPGILFACFVAWLTTLAMGGHPNFDHALPWFLVPHVLGLLLVAQLATADSFTHLYRGGLLLTLILSTAMAAWPDYAVGPWLMMVLGLASAPVAVGMGVMLRRSPAPVTMAATGLVIGNAITVLTVVVAPGWLSLLVIFGALAALLWLQPQPAAPRSASTPGLMRYLPFILVFEIIGGLMYAALLPDYRAIANLPGAEIVTYVIATLMAARIRLLAPRHRLLAVGVVLALLSMLAWYALPSPLGEHVAIHLLMAAFGSINILLLSHLLRFDNQIKAHGLGLAALCTGIVTGHLLWAWLGTWLEAIAVIGMISLNFAVLVLYLLDREPVTRRQADSTQPPTRGQTLLALLSDQEQQVLKQIEAGQTYREVSSALGISESSVKTYMQRIYRKAGVYSRRQLESWLQQPAIDDHPPQIRPPGATASGVLPAATRGVTAKPR